MKKKKGYGLFGTNRRKPAKKVDKYTEEYFEDYDEEYYEEEYDSEYYADEDERRERQAPGDGRRNPQCKKTSGRLRHFSRA